MTDDNLRYLLICPFKIKKQKLQSKYSTLLNSQSQQCSFLSWLLLSASASNTKLPICFFFLHLWIFYNILQPWCLCLNIHIITYLVHDFSWISALNKITSLRRILSIQDNAIICFQECGTNMPTNPNPTAKNAEAWSKRYMK